MSKFPQNFTKLKSCRFNKFGQAIIHKYVCEHEISLTKKSTWIMLILVNHVKNKPLIFGRFNNRLNFKLNNLLSTRQAIY